MRFWRVRDLIDLATPPRVRKGRGGRQENRKLSQGQAACLAALSAGGGLTVAQAAAATGASLCVTATRLESLAARGLARHEGHRPALWFRANDEGGQT